MKLFLIVLDSYYEKTRAFIYVPHNARTTVLRILSAATRIGWLLSVKLSTWKAVLTIITVATVGCLSMTVGILTALQTDTW